MDVTTKSKYAKKGQKQSKVSVAEPDRTTEIPDRVWRAWPQQYTADMAKAKIAAEDRRRSEKLRRSLKLLCEEGIPPDVNPNHLAPQLREVYRSLTVTAIRASQARERREEIQVLMEDAGNNSQPKIQGKTSRNKKSTRKQLEDCKPPSPKMSLRSPPSRTANTVSETKNSTIGSQQKQKSPSGNISSNKHSARPIPSKKSRGKQSSDMVVDQRPAVGASKGSATSPPVSEMATAPRYWLRARKVTKYSA